MRFFLALAVGKILRFVGAFSGRSTNLPGKAALKICRDFYKHLKIEGRIIAVTGSNGKTTTSAVIAHILRKQGKSVIHNTEGANIVSGIATTLLDAADFSGRISADFLVFEVDERHSRLIFADISPDIFLINNLLRDQVVRNGHPDLIAEKISEAVGKDTLLVLNSNDPVSQLIAPQNKRVYFGMGRTSASADICAEITNDCKICPKCFGKIRYEFYHYNHIGSFKCENCGYETPPADFFADRVNFETGKFEINGLPASVTYNTEFHFMNTTAAVAVAVSAGVELADAIKSAASFEVSSGRYTEFTVAGRPATLMLTKQNSVSLDRSISFALGKPDPKTVVFYVNNVIYMENKDISWLYDVSFERLLESDCQVVCAGSRAYDLAVRLELAGFNSERLFIAQKTEDIRSMTDRTRGPIYILAASAFGNEDGILDALKPDAGGEPKEG